MVRRAHGTWALGLVIAAGCSANAPQAENTTSSAAVASSNGTTAPSSTGSSVNTTTSAGSGTTSSSSGVGTGPVVDAGGTPVDATASPEASSGADGAAGGQTGSDASTASDAGPGVRFVARVDYESATGPRFAWSGSTILAQFTGSSIGIKLSGPPTYFDVTIDGTLQATPILLATGTTNYSLATNLDGGVHSLSVFRRNEPSVNGTGVTTYLGLTLDPGGALLAPTAPSARRIEIVGDSVTSGFGDDSVNGACPDALLAQNYDHAYGPVAARTVGADLITIAWTGKGMYRNDDGTTTMTMPDMYGLSLPTVSTSTWNFASWIPDAVVIYLGNNDFGQGDPGQQYVTTYNAFIARVRMNYPNALIICTIGPNLTDPKLTEERTYVQGIVTTQNTAGDMNVVFLEMPQPLASEGTGCGGHPLAVTHARMGAALATLLQTKLNW
ncbi:MAG: SGNH/GDSL hydrolase family protein [Polyangiaceae bacterium]|jgi:hypothetical protein